MHPWPRSHSPSSLDAVFQECIVAPNALGLDKHGVSEALLLDVASCFVVVPAPATPARVLHLPAPHGAGGYNCLVLASPPSRLHADATVPGGLSPPCSRHAHPSHGVHRRPPTQGAATRLAARQTRPRQQQSQSIPVASRAGGSPCGQRGWGSRCRPSAGHDSQCPATARIAGLSDARRTCRRARKQRATRGQGAPCGRGSRRVGEA